MLTELFSSAGEFGGTAQQALARSGRRRDPDRQLLVRRALQFAELESSIVRQECALRWATWDVPDADRRLRIAVGGFEAKRRAQLAQSALLAVARRSAVVGLISPVGQHRPLFG